MKALLVAGTRPEAIKLSPVKQALGDDATVLFTGQHRDLYEDALLKPDICLKWRGIEALPIDMKSFDVVVVEGDTFSAFSGALTAFLQGVPVAHVEAGLRTTTKFRPFPEEMLRRLISEIADIHFAPTQRAAANLLGRDEVHIVGNTVVDAALEARGLPARFPFESYALATVHRRESWGEPLRDIIAALENLPLEVKLVVHPAVETDVRRMVRFTQILEPAPYREMISLVANARVLLTDSGGLQEEAPILGTPVVVLRNETERIEGIEEGVAWLAGTTQEGIMRATKAALLAGRRSSMIYGDGHAGERIVTILRERFA